MKALSIKPPWSTMIVAGLKFVENRTWYCSHRGPLLIHSSKTWDSAGAEFIVKQHPELKGFIYVSRHLKGMLIGRVAMKDCVTKSNLKWFCGPYGFILDCQIEFYREDAIPYKGQLGLFNVPDDLVKQAIKKATQ